jgi:amino acid adenylation domain-containing protein
MNLLAAFTNAAKANAGITLVCANGAEKTLPYSAVYSTAKKILGALQHKGVKPGNEVVIQTDDNELFIHIFWACIMGRIIPVPLSCGVQAEQKLKLFKVWKYLHNPFLACDEEQFKRLELTASEVQDGKDPLGRYLPVSFLLAFEHDGQEAAIEPHELAYIQFSSGSTGEPKGVCLTHDNLVSNTQDIIKSLQITSEDRLLSWMPLTHDMGLIGFLLTGIVQAIDIVSIPTALFVRRPLLWMDKAAQHRATVLYSPNFGLQYFLSAFTNTAAPGWDLHCVRIIVNGAESISVATCNNFIQALQPYGLHEKVMLSAYGLAEASVEVAAMPAGTAMQQYFLKRESLNIGNPVELLDGHAAGSVSFVDVGYPISDCAVRICDDADNILPESTIGHIQIKGRNVTRGYYNNPDATAAVFTKDNWLKTGDIGFMRNGRMVITGRLKNIIIINGQNYYPKDIEDVITNAGIAAAGTVIACGITGAQQKAEELVLFVLHKGAPEDMVHTGRKMREIVLNEIGIYVSHVLPVKKLPKTTSGKVQHFILAEQYSKGAFNEYIALAGKDEIQDAVSLAGGQDLTASLCALANRLLGRTDINEHTPLLNTGMSSVLAMQFINRVTELTGKKIPLGAIFQHNDLASFAAFINTGAATGNLPPITKTVQSEYYDLSLAQKRIWLECQFNKNSVAYNVPVVLRVKGSFNEHLLRQSVNELVKKYEILRTSFEMAEGVPKQKLHSYADELCHFHRVDLRHLPNAAGEAGFFYSRDCNTPFNLGQPCQLRITLLQVAKNEYILSLVFHHILVDGWSLQLLLKELCSVYNLLAAGNKLESTAPALQYRDYAAWQIQLAQSNLLEPHRAYWLNELAGWPAATGLPRQQRQAANAGSILLDQYTQPFGRECFEQLETLCAKHQASRFSILVALLNVILHRYTNRKDIVVGFDSAGRISSDIEPLIGYTLNTLCLRTAIDPTQGFAQLARQVADKIGAALTHQAYPFEQLLAEMQLQDKNKERSLFDVLVLYQNFYAETEAIRFNNCEIQKEPVFIREGFVNLLLDITENGQGLDFVIHYNQDAYSAAFIQRFGNHIVNLLRAVAANDDGPIGFCDFLSTEEKKLLLPAGSLPAEAPLPVQDLFERTAVQAPNAVAVCAGETKLTYRQLNTRANAVAHFLKRKGIGPNDFVGFMISRNEKMIVVLLGILKAGAAYVAIDPQFPVSRCQQMVTDSGMKCLLTGSELLETLGNHFDADFLVNTDSAAFNEKPLPNPATAIRPEDLAYVIYTSGSTGKPKGVLISHGSMAAYVQQFIQYFNISSADVFIQQGSVSFDVIIEEIFPVLCMGGRIVIAEHGARDVNALLRLISAHRVTMLSTTPLVLNQINDQLDSRIFSLRAVISGGDVLHASYIDNLFRNVAIYNTYGPSEATVCTAYKKVTKLEDAALIGKPIAGRRVYVLDENRQLLPKGCIGEMHLEGGLAKGYLNLPQQSAAKFIANPFDPGTRLYCSGDLARWTEENELEFIGRNDEQVKIRGIRIEPGEVEAAIETLATIRSAAVLVHEEMGEKRLVAFVEVKKEYDEDALRAHLQQCLPPYMRPVAIIEVPQIPLTNSGKADREALRQAIPAGMLQARVRAAVPPQTRSEKLLARIWEELLRRTDVSVNDDFFEIGGHSLTANQLVNKIYQSTGVEISVTDIFEHATIRRQGALITQLEQKKFRFIELS